MKKISAILLALSVVFTPLYAQKNPDLRNLAKQSMQRAELILPEVEGYNIYKADFHVHTIYSDGAVSPKGRVIEAYYDGLDIIAITDHIEVRSLEKSFLQATKGYHKKMPEAVNYHISRKPADKRGILADLNVSYQGAKKEGEKRGIMVIPGAEITRHPDLYGHYNALFVKDVNAIYDVDPEISIRNAKSQGAIITHNHPGWRRTTVDKNEFHQKVYSAGLIDGVEVVNGAFFGAKLIKRCLDENLFMVAATDVHGPTGPEFLQRGYFRNCTFVLAKECSEEAIRQALDEKRTIAFAYNNVMGSEKLIKALFDASVTIKVLSTNDKGTRVVALTNMSSIPYHIRSGKSGNGVIINPFQTVTMNVNKNKNLEFWVLNAWTADEKTPNGKHPYYSYSLNEN